MSKPAGLRGAAWKRKAYTKNEKACKCLHEGACIKMPAWTCLHENACVEYMQACTTNEQVDNPNL